MSPSRPSRTDAAHHDSNSTGNNDEERLGGTLETCQGREDDEAHDGGGHVEDRTAPENECSTGDGTRGRGGDSGALCIMGDAEAGLEQLYHFCNSSDGVSGEWLGVAALAAGVANLLLTFAMSAILPSGSALVGALGLGALCAHSWGARPVFRSLAPQQRAFQAGTAHSESGGSGPTGSATGRAASAPKRR